MPAQRQGLRVPPPDRTAPRAATTAPGRPRTGATSESVEEFQKYIASQPAWAVIAPMMRGWHAKYAHAALTDAFIEVKKGDGSGKCDNPEAPAKHSGL